MQFLSYIHSIGVGIVSYVSDILHIEYITAWYITMIVVIYLFVVISVVQYTTKRKRLYIEREKNLTFTIDRIRYAYARTLHEHPALIDTIDAKYRSTGLHASLDGLESYISHIYMYKKHIKDVESHLQTRIVPDTIWKKIDTLAKQLPTTKLSYTIARFLTAGVYR